MINDNNNIIGIRHPNFLGALAWENEESDSELKTVFFFELVEISLE